MRNGVLIGAAVLVLSTSAFAAQHEAYDAHTANSQADQQLSYWDGYHGYYRDGFYRDRYWARRHWCARHPGRCYRRWYW